MADPKKTIALRWGEFAENTTFKDLSPELVRKSKEFILDIIGCILGAKHVPGSQIIAKTLLAQGGTQDSTVFNYTAKLPAPNAAFINAAAGHAFDMDDDHRRGTLHCSVVVFPAVLAMAERYGASGKEVITAYALGSELMIRLGAAFLGQTYYQGFHPTGTVGGGGAAIGAGKIIGLPAKKLEMAQSLAQGMAAGLLEWKAQGSWSKRTNAGHAAMTGVLSAQLAREGYIAPTTIYEGDDGFIRAYSYKDQYDLNVITDRLGSYWELEYNSIKPHACCRFSCPIVDAGLDVRRKYSPKIEDIEDVLVKCQKYTMKVLTVPRELKYNPKTEVDLQFNLPYAAAVALAKGQAMTTEFTEEAAQDPVVHALMQKVRGEEDPELEKVYPEKYPIRIIVTMKNGQKYESYIDYPVGDPENPIPHADLIAKFEYLTSVHKDKAKIKAIIDICEKLEDLNDINELARLLA
ncbi:MAG: MmgE/PrpD family protein [Desulfarculales bacterium]|jgi:2-methylcitrate dehydratase PrpD|nr:MmgE/PrpD family protein [Desulfarculales bacterium]